MATGSPTTELQKTFIAMVFAFAISFVAQQVAEYLIVITNNWQSLPLAFISGESQDNTLAKLVAVGSHLFLSTLMISVSWVMWSRSQAAGHLEDVKEVFSIKFITFILEILLVTIYYSLAKTAETDFAEYGKTKLADSYVTDLSAKPEALQMAAIFGIFAIWDFIVDVVKSPRNPAASSRTETVKNYIPGITVYCFVSILCAASSLLIFYTAPQDGLPQNAFAGDLALVVVLLFFHEGKRVEYYLLKLLPLEKTRNNTKRVPTKYSDFLLGVMVVTYLICLLFINSKCFQRSLGW